MDWAWKLVHGAQTPLPGKKPYNTESDLLREVKSDIENGITKNNGKAPQVFVMGALGRCKCITRSNIPSKYTVFE